MEVEANIEYTMHIGSPESNHKSISFKLPATVDY
jgi:hypothetical protein